MSRVETEILTRLYQTEINNLLEMANPRSSKVKITEDRATGRRKHLICRWVLEGGELVCQWIVKN
jgi:hypothetical protein